MDFLAITPIAKQIEDKLGSYFVGRDSTASHSKLTASAFCCHAGYILNLELLGVNKS